MMKNSPKIKPIKGNSNKQKVLSLKLLQAAIPLYILLLFQPSGAFAAIKYSILACDNVTNGGSIQGDEFGCPDPTYDPAPITNLDFPTGGTGVLEYMWIYTTGDPSAPISAWLPIPNSDAPDYDPGPISVTTHFRRCARRSGCDEFVGETNYVTKGIRCCSNVTDGGQIEEDQQICGTQLDPEIIRNALLPSGGNGTIEYQWYESLTGTPFVPGSPDWTLINGATGEDFDPDTITQTTFYIRCSRRSDCLDYTGKSNIVAVRLFEIPTLDTIIKLDLTCFESNDGAIDLQISGGQQPFDFTWDPDLGNVEDPTGLVAGTYNVSVSDANSCGFSAEVVLSQPSQITSSVTVSIDSCDYSTGGTLVASAENGIPPYQYTWSDPLNTTGEILDNVGTGWYFVTITDSTGCTVIDSGFVQLLEPYFLTFQKVDITCNGFSNGAVSAFLSGRPGNFLFQWNDPGQSTNAAIDSLSAGFYSLTVTDELGCTLTDSIEITQPDELGISLIPSPAGCNLAGGRADAIVSGGTAPYFYLWNDPGAQITPSAGNLIPGVYTVSVTDSQGCELVDSVQVGFSLGNVQLQFSKQDVSCRGLNNGQAWVVASGGLAPYSFIWDDPAAQTGDTLRNVPEGIYNVVARDAEGCEATGQISITYLSVLDLSLQKQDETCRGLNNGQAWVVPSGGLAPYTFIWDDPAAQTGDTLRNVPEGIYNVAATDAEGCKATGQISITYLSDISLSLQKSDARCFGDHNGTINSQVSGAFGDVFYLWDNGQITPNLITLGAGWFKLVVEDDLGCSATDSIQILEPALLICDVEITSDYNGFDISRYGGVDGSILGSASGGTGPYNFNWSNNRTGSNLTGLIAGPYFLTVTDANGCSCTNGVTLTQPAKIQGYTWRDLNNNGIQEVNEPALAGVNVSALGTDLIGNPVSFNTLSNAQGNYFFDQIPAGNFYVHFETPTGFQITQKDAGNNDNLDSDAFSATGFTDTFGLQLGNLTARDCGYKFYNPSLDVGDYVWYDSNRNGIQDPLEGGVFDFTVSLMDAGTNTILRTQNTDADGKYLFSNVAPGNYYILFHPISVSSGSKFTKRNEGSDDEIDSDADTITGRTPAFTLVTNQPDNLSLDAGIYQICDNITFGGNITGDEQLCGPGHIAQTITNVNFPSGGFGTIEYLWLYSYSPVFLGPGDPNWIMIPNSNTPDYSPGIINQTTYFIRCSRRNGCTDYPGETNVVKKEILPLPNAVIVNPPTTVCQSQSANFSAEPSSGGATYFWQFGAGSSPQTADSRQVSGVSWNSTGIKRVILAVSRFGCTARDTALVNVVNCANRLGLFNFFNATQLSNSMIKLDWETKSSDEQTIFILEKSLNGTDFIEITRLVGKSLPAGNQYSFSDFSQMGKTNYYRLKHQDIWSNFIYSEIKEVAMTEMVDLGGKVYPNPAPEKIRYELPVSNIKSRNIDLVDEKGAILQSKILPAGALFIEFELQKLPIGVYFLHIKSDNGQEEIHKILHFK